MDNQTTFEEISDELPVLKYKSKIRKLLAKHGACVVTSETGSGKSTKIPQFLLPLSGKNRIVITQPRRIAAISLAQRVSLEMGCEVGERVGYMIRFDSRVTPDSKLIYATDGALLRESATDPLLLSYSIIVLDEAHERALHTDILFGVVKRAQKQRRENDLPILRILIMSATLDVDKFANFFSAPVLHVHGRRFPVRIFHAAQHYTQNHVELAYNAIRNLHTKFDLSDDFLVFLCGQDDIEHLKVLLERDLHQVIIYPLFSAISIKSQLVIYQNLPGMRKIILSTNIAETSITIPGVKVVVDPGYRKEKHYNPETNMISLRVQRISKAEAKQRSGRVGRTESGFCYRLYTRDMYLNEFDPQQTPEILRCNLSSVLLTLLSSGIQDPKNFDWIDKPDDKNFQNSWQDLLNLQAVILNPEKPLRYKLTNYGEIMAKLPINPRFAKILILAALNFSCSVEIAMVVAILSEQNIFCFQKLANNEAMVRNINQFKSPHGDVLTLLHIFGSFKATSKTLKRGSLKAWCEDRGLNYKALSNAKKILKQLYSKMSTLGLPKISAASTYHSSDYEARVIVTCMLCGFFDCTAYYSSQGLFFHYQKSVTSLLLMVRNSMYTLLRCYTIQSLFFLILDTNFCFILKKSLQPIIL